MQTQKPNRLKSKIKDRLTIKEIEEHIDSKSAR